MKQCPLCLRTHKEKSCPHCDHRGLDVERMRGSERWKRLSRDIRINNPTCAKCKMRRSEVAHHKIPASERQELFFVRDNIVALCVDCHKQEHEWKN